MKTDRSLTPTVAILGLVAIEGMAMHYGVDPQLMWAILGISGLGGYQIRQKVKQLEKPRLRESKT